MRSLSILICLGLILPPACMPGPDITDEVVAKYIKAYKNLKRIAPELAERMAASQGDKVDMDKAMAGYNEIDQAIKDAGFSGYPEFVQVNSKIAWAFNYLQAQNFMTRMDRMQGIGLEEIEKSLNDPNVPEEAKAELRVARTRIITEYAKNKKWADGTMKVVRVFNDDKTLAVIERNRKEIESAFTGGIQQPETEFFGRKL